MSRNQIIIVVLLLLALVQITITWRHRSRDTSTTLSPGSQAERLSTWSDMKRLPLNDENIKNFVGDILKTETLSLPPAASKVQAEHLSEEQKQDIHDALEGFFTAYRGSNPAPVFNYLTVLRGKTEFPDEVKKAVLEAAKQSNPSLKLESDQDMFNFVWNLGSKGIGFGNLLESSGRISFWETNAPLTDEQHIQKILDEPDLFKNTVSVPHVFTSSQKLIQLLQKGEKVLFADAYFVSELIPEKDKDICAFGLRFWWNEETKKWTPYILILVTPEVRQDVQFPF
ncbi:hypothetical protein FACS189419_08160 [Planctomycetales bacterium]|nr:hypothetical protein FACS189419_08160 [Planctomycetales bacterium]